MPVAARIPEPPPVGAKRSRIPGLLAVAATAALVYANALPNEFVWDDVTQVRDNPTIRRLDALPAAFAGSYWKGTDSPFGDAHYRPFTTASYILSYAVTGPDARAFRAVNVALHAGSAVLVALIAAELGLAWGAAVLAGLLFGVHPANVETVAWVVGRAELAASCCGLAALLAWIRAFRDRGAALAGASGAILLAALLFKESAASVVGVAFAVALVLEDAPLGARIRRAAVWAAPLALAVAGYVALRHAALGSARYEDTVYFAAVPGWRVFLTMTKVTAYYLWLLVAPFRLRAHYDLVDVPVPVSLLEPAVLAACALEAALLASVAWGLVTRRRGAVGGAWIAAGLAPYLHVVPFQWLMAERFMYQASAGFAVLVAAGAESAAKLAPSSGARRALAAAACAVLVALGARSALRNRDWADEVVFFSKMVEQEPTLAPARVCLSRALVSRGRVAEGMRQLEIARTLGWRPDLASGDR